MHVRRGPTQNITAEEYCRRGRHAPRNVRVRGTTMATRLLPLNVGSGDRAVRAILGALLLSFVFVGPHTPWGWLGLVPLATAIVGSCPLYTILGIDTCRRAAHR